MAVASTMLFLALSAIAVVYDDEASFADPARSAAFGEGFASPALEVLPGATEKVLWQPPGYLVLLATWFRIFGFGLFQGRALSAVAAGIALGLIYALVARYTPRRFVTLGVVAALVSPWMLRTGTIIRPDAVTLACVAAAVLATVSWRDRSSWRTVIIMVLSVAGAMLAHPIGAMAGLFSALYLVLMGRWRIAVLTLVTAGLLVAVAWGEFVAGYWPLFLEQMQLQGARKTGLDLLSLWTSQDISRRLGYAPLAAAVAVLLLRRRSVPLALLLAVGVAVLAATLGLEEHYPVYVTTLGAPLVALAAMRAVEQWKLRVVAVVVLAVALVAVAPDALFVTRGIRDVGVQSEIETATGGRPLFLGPGAAAAYFGEPSRVRLFAPVPLDPAAVGEVARRQGTIVTAGALPPMSGVSLEQNTGVTGRRVYTIR